MSLSRIDLTPKNAGSAATTVPRTASLLYHDGEDGGIYPPPLSPSVVSGKACVRLSRSLFSLLLTPCVLGSLWREGFVLLCVATSLLVAPGRPPCGGRKAKNML